MSYSLRLRQRWFICLLLCAILFGQPVSSFGQPTVLLPETADRLPLRSVVESFVDSTRSRTIAEVSTNRQFRPVLSAIPNFGITSSNQQARPVWLRFRLRNSANQPQAWLAKVNFWCFDSLQLFILDQRNRVLSASAKQGWRQPVGQRVRQHRYFWFPVTVPARQTVTAYLRVLKTRGTQIVPLELVRASAYETVGQINYLFWGGTFFTLLFVLAGSLFLFLTTNDRVYWKYVLCLLGLIGFFFINDGFLNQYAFNVQFWLPRQNIYFLFPLGLFYSQLLFVRTFLSLRHTSAHWWHRVGTGVLWCGVVCLLMLTGEQFVPFSARLAYVLTALFSVFYWLPMPVIIAYITVNLRRKQHRPEAWLYLAAVAPFYTLNFGQVLANFGLLPTYGPVADFVWYAGAALYEVLLLTLGLAYRYKMNRDETEQLLAERTRQQKHTYETKVKSLAMTNRLLLEKERIARDLHDNVGAHLAFVVTNLTHISGQAEKQPVTNGRQWAGQLRAIVAHTRDAVKLLRETIWAIHQENFTVEEFAERLDQYINRYVHEPNGLHVDLSVTGMVTQRLTSMQVLNLFRIVQESLNNVLKHARATQAQVTLDVQAGGQLTLSIHDNGQGIHPANGSISEQHYGLKNMETRAHELGGSFRIFADGGTTVEIVVG